MNEPMPRRAGIIIAIDGPAASGKSSTARAVADALGYRYLDSGAFYRAVTLAALEAGVPPDRWSDLTRHDLDRFDIRVDEAEAGYRLSIAGEDVGERIRSQGVTALVSRMAALPAVRTWLLDALRSAGRGGGLVADGRDIGTVVFPDAELKIFLVCEARERAARRLRQQGIHRPSTNELVAETRRLEERDRLDSSRDAAPLSRAPDAVLLDTTDLDFPDQVSTIVDLARGREA